MDFELDEAKAVWNFALHGVAFLDAALIFAGPVPEAEDRRAAYGERRFRALGAVEGEFFPVAYTWRGTARRIISAWKVDDDGRRRYAAILSG